MEPGQILECEIVSVIKTGKITKSGVVIIEVVVDITRMMTHVHKYYDEKTGEYVVKETSGSLTLNEERVPAEMKEVLYIKDGCLYWTKKVSVGDEVVQINIIRKQDIKSAKKSIRNLSPSTDFSKFLRNMPELPEKALVA